MKKEDCLCACNDVIYLAGCVVNNQTPDKERAEKMDMEQLYQAADKHALTAIVGYALEEAGVRNEQFHQAWAKSIRKVTVMDIDKELLFQEMEKEKIWYTPLKGMVIKDLYPSIGLRQMSDFDILFDPMYAQTVHDIMLQLGYTCAYFGKASHNVYYKRPVSNFELHSSLFGENHKQEIFEYYHDVKSRLIKDEENQYGYHFSVNDLYIYLTAHEYKHFSQSGTGLRSVLDTYVFWQKCGAQLDGDYIAAETKKMGIDEFEQQNRSLALHLFGSGQLTEHEREMLEYIVSSGTYGIRQHRIENTVKQYGSIRKGKMAYIFHGFFPTMKSIKAYHPFYYKHKFLLPVLVVYRLVRALTVNLKKTTTTIKTLRKMK